MKSALGRRRWLLLLLVAMLCAPPAGCVRRRLTVRSTPPGALVYVDGQFIGATPVSTDFTYYGTRNIELIKDGFETLRVKQRFNPPWYEAPGLDFVNENLNPHEIRDERELHFTLEAQRITPAAELLDRADYLRNGARQGVVTPMPQAYPLGAGDAWGADVPAPAADGAAGGPPPPAGPPPPGDWIGPSPRELAPDASGAGYRPPGRDFY
jgi:hypothetical protein